jgi:hypothetical protein
MKVLIATTSVLISSSAIASPNCWLNDKTGSHVDFNVASGAVDGGSFGSVQLTKGSRGESILSYSLNGEAVYVSFKRYVSITQQANDAARTTQNIVCQ